MSKDNKPKDTSPPVKRVAPARKVPTVSAPASPYKRKLTDKETKKQSATDKLNMATEAAQARHKAARADIAKDKERKKKKSK